MTPRAAWIGLVVVAGCRDPLPAPSAVNVEPPMGSIDGIPTAPVNGTLHGLVFVARDARYIVDRRDGYAHTDIKLSASALEAPCAPFRPDTTSSLWIRIDGPSPLETRDLRVGPGLGRPYSVHYQVHDGERWIGVGNGSALLSLHAPGPDGHVAGAIAVCFPDRDKSCVSGSFDAVSCPSRLDLPARGAPPIEREPPPTRASSSAAPSASAPRH
jgi:hypothetical protein